MKQQTVDEPSLQALEQAAEIFGLLATPVRLHIVSALCQGEKNVSELRGLIGVAQSNISQHLIMLYRSGMVARRRSGAQVFYRIADEFLALVSGVVSSQVSPRLAMQIV